MIECSCSNSRVSSDLSVPDNWNSDDPGDNSVSGHGLSYGANVHPGSRVASASSVPSRHRFSANVYLGSRVASSVPSIHRSHVGSPVSSAVASGSRVTSGDWFLVGSAVPSNDDSSSLSLLSSCSSCGSSSGGLDLFIVRVAVAVDVSGDTGADMIASHNFTNRTGDVRPRVSSGVLHDVVDSVKDPVSRGGGDFIPDEDVVDLLEHIAGSDPAIDLSHDFPGG